MKILFITNRLDGTDGWSRYSRDIISAVMRAGHAAEVLVEANIPDFPAIQHAILESPLSYMANPIENYRLARMIRKHSRIFKPDVIHFLAEPYGNAAAFLKTPKLLLTVHGTYSYIPNLIHESYKRYASKWMLRKTYERLNKVIAVSRYTRDYLAESIRKDFGSEWQADKIIVINNGIDLAAFTSAPIRKPKDFGASERKKILFIGGIKPRKGLLESLQALKAYKQKFGSDFIFTIAGKFYEKSLYFQRLKAFISDNGLQNNVEFIGRVSEEEKKDLYQRADVFLMLSIREGNAFEGFGLVYLEANAFGLPVIGSRGCGAEDAIKDGVSGFLVDSAKPEEIAAKLNEVLKSNKDIFEFQAKRWAKEHDISKVAQQLISLYKSN